MKSRWGQVIDNVDPYYNPGLTPTGEDFALGLRLGVPNWQGDQRTNGAACYLG